MNVNQKNILVAWKIAPEIKKLVSNRFFMDCGNYNPKEDTKEVFNRIVCESIMTMFHLDNWKKSKQMSLYLNENATKDEFEVFENELNRLYEITDQDTVGKLFNSKIHLYGSLLFIHLHSLELKILNLLIFLKSFRKHYIARHL